MGKVTNEQFLIQVKADIEKALTDFKKLSGELEGTGSAGEKAGKKVGVLETNMRKMVAAAAAYISLRTAQKILADADAWAVLQSRIQSATRTTGDYNQVSEQLFKISKDNGQQMETTVALFQNLARTAPELGATNREMLSLTNTVQQLGIISGTTLAQQRSGLLQFTQGLAAGVFRAEEFNSIIENLPELANRIAQGLGLTVGQLRQAVIDGRILSQDVFDAIQEQAGEINKEFEQIEDSNARAAQARNNSLTNYLAALDDVIGATETLAALNREISDRLDYQTQKLQEDELAEAQRKRAELMVQYQQATANMWDQNSAFAQSYIVQIDELDRKIKSLLPSAEENLINSAIDQIEAEIDNAFKRSEELTRAFQQHQDMLDEQWNADDDRAWSAEQRQQLDAYNKSLQEFIDRLDPAGAATRDLHTDLDRLNKLFFEDEAISGDRYDQLVAALLGASKAAETATAELDAMDRALDLIDQQFAQLEEAEARQIAGLENIGKTGRESFDSMTAAIRGWGNDFTETLVDMAMKGKFEFASFRDAVIRDLLRIAVYQNITRPLFHSIFPNAGFGPSAAVPAGVNHIGGLVGAGGSTTTVHPAVFALAPRYHSGGIAGLRPNEVPTILERGEEVLTRDDPRHIANRMAGGGTVRVEVHNQNTPIEATSTDVSFDGDAMVVSVFTRDIKTGGPIDSMLRNTYKLGR